MVYFRIGGGSYICRVNYCAKSTGTVADDLATYVVYFFHNKSTLSLRVCNSILFSSFTIIIITRNK